jgi:hypothetical protein
MKFAPTLLAISRLPLGDWHPVRPIRFAVNDFARAVGIHPDDAPAALRKIGVDVSSPRSVYDHVVEHLAIVAEGF